MAVPVEKDYQKIVSFEVISGGYKEDKKEIKYNLFAKSEV